MSKPAVQNITASPRTTTDQSMIVPEGGLTATQLATGARPSDAPSQKWERFVKRLLYEYKQMKIRTKGAKTSGHGFLYTARNIAAARIKIVMHPAKNHLANRSDNLPVGSSRFDVRGLMQSSP